MKRTSMRILVFQLGARRHYAVPRALASHHALATLVTDACAYSWPFLWFRHAGIRIAAILSILNRVPQGIDQQSVVSLFKFYWTNLLLERFVQRPHSGAERWALRNARFASCVAKRGVSEFDAVYGYNAAALEVFEEAKKLKKICVLDQTAAPWRFNTKLLEREQRIWPGWEFEPADADVLNVMARREEAEWKLADLIICGSQFVVDCMRSEGGPWEKCRVVSYPNQHGFTKPVMSSDTGSVMNASEDTRPQRLLFAGTLQLRKGIQYFFRMAEMLDDCGYQWRAVGPSMLSSNAMASLATKVEIVGRVPRGEMAAHYAWADALVFPTLSEGSANVCLEALGMGKTVITTPAAGIFEGDYPGLYIVGIEEMPEFLRHFKLPKTTDGSSMPVRSIEDYGRDLLAAICS